MMDNWVIHILVFLAVSTVSHGDDSHVREEHSDHISNEKLSIHWEV